MKTFLESTQEQAAKAKAIIASGTAELPKLQIEVNETKAAFTPFANQNHSSAAKSALHTAWSDASQALEIRKRSISAAQGILRDCEPFLEAHSDLAAARIAYCSARETVKVSLEEMANLGKLRAELHGELADLNARNKEALAAYGQNAITARLTGQPAIPTSKLIATLNADIESRHATLESVESMLISHEKQREFATDSAKQSRDKLQFARGQVAEIEYRDAIASIAPQIAVYLAAKGYDKSIEFAPGRERIEAANALLETELDQLS